MIDKPISGIL